MENDVATTDQLMAENRDLRARLEAAEETLRAIRSCEVDALVVRQGDQDRVCTLHGADAAYRTFVELMRQGAATVDADGTILYCNRHFAELLHSPVEKTTGASFYDFVAPEAEGVLRALLWEALTSSCVTRDFMLCGRDGSAISTVLTATALNADGLSCICLVVTDLTDRDARISAEAENRAKDRFLAALSHELRTPLTPVTMIVSALEGDARLPEEAREALAGVRRNIELETRLIDDLLDLSRVISGKLRLRLEPVSLRSLIESVLEMVRSDVDQKRLGIRCHWNARIDRVHGDSSRLQQVIWNIVKNAIKFSGAGSVIEICLDNPAEQEVRLEVRDQGIGIKASLLPRIFDAFEQGDGAASAASTAGGLGLGLAIARAVVESHGGTIEAQSEGEGKGASVVVRLPVTSLELPASRAPGSDGSAAVGSGGSRLLLVEDHVETAVVISRLLREFGYEVKVAGSMAEALEHTVKDTFDVVVSDIGLPDGTGYDLMKRIRETCSVPGVALSGYGMEDDIARSREVGFAEHVVKPVNLPELQSAIRRALAKGG